jgi:hypothetical protein
MIWGPQIYLSFKKMNIIATQMWQMYGFNGNNYSKRVNDYSSDNEYSLVENLNH